MADTFTAVDLSRLPPPAVVEVLDYEAIYAQLLAALQAFVPNFDATVESDPAVKLLQVVAYREMLLRQSVNDAAGGVMVAFAGGADLDHLAAVFGVTRLLIDAGDPEHNIAPTYESDTDLRRRVLLAPEGYSVAGPEGAYIFHALSSDPDVLDASATSPDPGEVLVTILSRVGDGDPAPDLVAAVDAYLSAESRRPLTDHVTVQAAGIIEFSVTATLTTYNGPDSAIVLAAANAGLTAYLADNHRLGRDVTRSGLFRALHVEGVQNVTLTHPAADVVVDRTQAAWCTGRAVTHAGIGE